MGGFGSKHAGHVAEEGVAKPRSASGDAEQSPQAFVVSFSPDTPTMQLPASTASAQPSQAPRQKQPASSLHVNSRLISETLANEWDGGGAAGTSGVALAEEEDLQAAISASLREERSGGGQAYPGVGHVCQASGGELRPRPPLNLGSSDEDGPGQRQAEPREKETAVTSKVAGGLGRAGLPGSAWVDNSDFHPRVGQASADTSSYAKARSASVGTRPQGKGASSRSNIVSLPRIGHAISADQQSMVKDLHEKIKDTISPEEEARAKNGALASSASSSLSDVRSLRREVMEDLNIDEPIIFNSRGQGPRGGSAERENERFNMGFHSCSAANTSPAAPARFESPPRKTPGKNSI